MARFDQTGVSPIQGSLSPQGVGAVDRSSLTSAQGDAAFTSGIGTAISGLAKAGEAILQANTTSKANKSLVDFTSSQLNIASAVEQGRFNSQEGRSRMRSNLLKAITANPALREDLIKAHGDIIGTSGLGKVVAEGTEEEKMQAAFREEAFNNGFLTPNAIGTPKGEEQVENYRQFKLQGELLARSSAKIAEATARINQDTALTNNQKATLSLIAEQEKKKARDGLINMAGSGLEKSANSFQEIQDAVENGTMTSQDAIQAINQEWAVYQSVVTGVGASAGSEFVNSALAPVQTLKDAALEVVSGKIDREVYENRIATAVAMQTLQIQNSNPEFLKLSATASMFKNMPPALASQITSAHAQIMNDASLNLPNNVTRLGTRDFSSYADMVSENIKAAQSGQTTGDAAQLTTEINNNLNSMLKGLDVYSASVEDPQSYNQVVDMLAKPSVGKWMSEQGGINKELLNPAQNVISQQYEQVVLPLIQQEFLNAQTATGLATTTSGGVATQELRTEATPSLVEPRFVGEGVSFVAKPGVSSGRSAPVGFDLNATLRTLNKNVAPVLNRLIRVHAHLGGNTNYKTAWEQNYMNLFLPQEPTGSEEE